MHKSIDKKDDYSLQNVDNVQNCRISSGHIAFIGRFLKFLSNKSILALCTCIMYLHFYLDYLSELSVNTTSGPSLLGEKETNFVREGLVVEF